MLGSAYKLAIPLFEIYITAYGDIYMDIKFNSLVIAMAFTGALVSGCSDKEDPAAPKAAAQAGVSKEVKQAPPVSPSLADQGVTILPAPSSPAGDYHQINRGLDLLYIYGANAAGGFDVSAEVDKIYAINDDLGDKKLADLVNKYRDGDQFAKRDVAKQIEPALKEKISKAASIRYVSVETQGNVSLGKYDFEKQGFLISNSLKNKPGEDSSTPFSRDAIHYSDVIGYRLSFINASDLNIFKVPESSAREISEYSKLHNVGFRLYGYVQSVAEDKLDSNHIKYVVVKITKAELISDIYDAPVKTLATIEL
ncbi:hypothetical protein [Pseudomonas aeruginosa]|uniref:hypothetical protein n=1 Tax=Pseudomonas aeruginosa TaxID=287 RepID=UPI000F54997A|nr:hypothetical protein [Pseudomonas aeruginosa]